MWFFYHEKNGPYRDTYYNIQGWNKTKYVNSFNIIRVEGAINEKTLALNQ